MVFKNNELKLLALLKRLEARKGNNERRVGELIDEHVYFLETSLEYFRKEDPKPHFEVLSSFYRMIGRVTRF